MCQLIRGISISLIRDWDARFVQHTHTCGHLYSIPILPCNMHYADKLSHCQIPLYLSPCACLCICISVSPIYPSHSFCNQVELCITHSCLCNLTLLFTALPPAFLSLPPSVFHSSNECDAVHLVSPLVLFFPALLLSYRLFVSLLFSVTQWQSN